VKGRAPTPTLSDDKRGDCGSHRQERAAAPRQNTFLALTDLTTIPEIKIAVLK